MLFRSDVLETMELEAGGFNPGAICPGVKLEELDPEPLTAEDEDEELGRIPVPPAYQSESLSNMSFIYFNNAIVHSGNSEMIVK